MVRPWIGHPQELRSLAWEEHRVRHAAQPTLDRRRIAFRISGADALGMSRPAHSLVGAAIGAGAGLFAGVLAALVGGFSSILFAFATDDDAWWARLLIQPPALWLLLGVLSGATIGFIYGRSDRPEGLPLRPDAA
jgi:hypothetical protein